MNSSLSPVRNALMSIQESGCSRPRHNEILPGAFDAPDHQYPTEVLLLLDAHSRIQYCSEGHPFLYTSKELVERPLRSLIHGLPLREGTPGYNISYVRCSFADNAWQRHLIDADHHLFNHVLPVDLHLRTIPIAGGYCLLGRLRLFSFGMKDSPEKMPRPGRQVTQPDMACPLPSCI